ncbi:integral membrane protein [Fusarium mundagurra]|uniref:Integral membrane protein n=1 Tax=Fusarium mundagurra TaxID=1567541 RepID=A0A8H5Y136_9HYPO|nr:integral membrane protein [Fusarium mundagurra]
MALDRVVSLILRAAELVFAAIVAGVNGEYLHNARSASSWQLGRFIYTEVVAALAILFSLLLLIPFSSTFVHWPLDIFMSINWWIVFGLLVDLIGNSCGRVFDWDNVHPVHGDHCGKTKAVIAFSFLSALLWLVSALVGFFWVRRRERTVARAEAAHHNRRRGPWFRSRV